ncbi:DUF2150 domain-containing protein [Halobacteriales archaeon SW_5_70_135]|nr:MAG: DUF2150 domain-containing protein [Halobacteriales archaeon SW_5_70_135]
MSEEASQEFYSAERWQNWVDRVRETEIDPENEDSARLLLNMQDDTAIAVAKVLTAVEDDRLGEEAALDELTDVRAVVLDEVDAEDEDTLMLIDGVQTSLACVIEAAMQYVAAGPADEATVEEYVDAAVDAEQAEEFDAAFSYVAQAGTLVVDGADLDMDLLDDVEYGLVTEWLNGIDSLQSALADPEVVEEEADE